jgi:hydrogenase maturation protease
MEKSVMIFCCGNPFVCDAGFGYHVSKVLEKTKLPTHVEFLEVGGSACMAPSYVEGKDKLIVVDIFRIKADPGTIVRLKPEEVPVTVDGVTDIAKFRLFEMLDQIKISGKCPEVVFIGVVPKDTKTYVEKLTPEIEKKIPEVIKLILKEVS